MLAIARPSGHSGICLAATSAPPARTRRPVAMTTFPVEASRTVTTIADPLRAPRRIRPGDALPLGASWDGHGTNFSVFSEVAQRVHLWLFDEAGRESRVPMPERTAFCWHVYLPGVGPGQMYGFRVEGPWSPGEGHRCNRAKLLMDPYARAI